MAISEFEKQRLANIERNKKLLNSLNINAISKDILGDIQKEEAKQNAEKPRRSKRKEAQTKVKKTQTPLEPTRRSRRIAGIDVSGNSLNDNKVLLLSELAEDKRRRQKAELEKLKAIRVNGDLSLIDLIKNDDEDDEDDIKALEKFKSYFDISKNFSIGDYYSTIQKNDNQPKDVVQAREDFKNLELYPGFAPNQLKLTKERMSYVTFHPSGEHKLIIGGDIGGNCGIFNPQSTDKIDITSFKLHGKTIAKYEFDINNSNKVYTASYDGSIRSTDLQTLKSTQVLIEPDDVGISDLNVNNVNEIYYTTLDGRFGRIDPRAGDHSSSTLFHFRLSNKKIGGFCINPNNKYQIATGSLDRTLKVWDIRAATDTSEWNEIDDLTSFHPYTTYDSRLSVSSVDWNATNDIVCNGYDDTVNIFNLDADFTKKQAPFSYDSFKPKTVIKHNCQTGRWVSILKSRWQRFPADSHQKFVIANMNKYFDVYNSNGVQIGHVTDPLMTNVPAVCNLHPTENWLVGGGASGKVYLFY